MKKLVLTAAVVSLLSSCASIVSHSRWPVTLNSNPSGAQVTVTGRDGGTVYAGSTPAAVSLKSGASYFRREKYKVTFTLPGYDARTVALDADVNGWYFGNLVFGGAVGFLIVDPATGAMYRLTQQAVQENLTPTRAFNSEEAGPNDLRIVSIDQVPSDLRRQMIPLK